jgi:hypothetical protein
MISAIIVFVLQGPFGNVVLDGASNILDVIIGELNFTLDGMKYLLCQSSSVCRSGGI